jgi:hypothetical protein
MKAVVGVPTILFPHFRTGDFAFDLRRGVPRIRRFAQSAMLALREGRLPLSRGLLVSLRNGPWWRLLESAERFEWDRGWLDHEGVHDGRGLRDFEDSLRGALDRGAPAFVVLPESERGRSAFRVMKSIADAAYGAAGQTSYRAWWLY